ncbi:MAG: hypothetical protein ABIV39_10180, partial [Verrucomicrobiota bacterium]
VRTVFLMIFGSYFGDWDVTNDFLRAPLCTPTYCLATMWAGRPHWFLHHMALGETLGYSTRLTQNNSGLYLPKKFGRQVHISLLGDPSLRMHMVKPVSSLTAVTNSGSISLSWISSPDENLQGYNVYRSPNPGGPFDRLTPEVITQTNFTDEFAEGGSFTYLVRAVKLEGSASGTYFNASQGIFLSATISSAAPTSPVNISNLRIERDQFMFRCDGQIGQRFAVESSPDLVQWTPLETNYLSSATLEFTNTLSSVGDVFYRTRLVP